MIDIRNLTKRYGNHEVLTDFSLTVVEGASVALWGPNGAGILVLRSILGLVAYGGEIRVAGFDARHQGKAVRSLIGYVPQELSVLRRDARHRLARLRRFASSARC